jgi:hypothetical protein
MPHFELHSRVVNYAPRCIFDKQQRSSIMIVNRPQIASLLIVLYDHMFTIKATGVDVIIIALTLTTNMPDSLSLAKLLWPVLTYFSHKLVLNLLINNDLPGTNTDNLS